MSVKAQSNRSLAGTEFWMTFTENVYDPADSVLHLIIAPQSRDTVRVFNPQINQSESFPVEPGKQNIIYLKFNYLWYSKLLGSANTAVRITSKRLIQVQAVNRLDGSTDVTSILPITVIENAHDYIVNHIGGDEGKESQVAIVAVDAGTTTIELKITADLYTGQGNGSVFTRTLKQGQVYILQALDTQSLAGSNIRVINNCNRVAVFCGTKCARFTPTTNCFSCDAVYEQLLPQSFAQKEFLYPPPPDNNKFSISIVATVNATSITLNGVFLKLLNKGEQLKRQVSGIQYLTADKPVSCMQILHSNGCNGAALITQGDPSLVQIMALNQTVNEAMFPLLRSPKFKHYLVMLSESSTKPIYIVNAIPMPAVNVMQFSISGKTFWYGILEIPSNTTYSIKSTTAFVAYNYGMAIAESYASVCGASFERSDADFKATPAYQCNKNNAIQFQSRGDSLGQTNWYFGDGNFGSGATVSHTYGKAGVFQVKMINSRQGFCPDTISRYVQVVDGPELNLPKDTFPCEGDPFRISLPLNRGYTYLWENGSNSFSRTFASNQKAVVTTTDTNGCITKDSINVVFKDCNNYELKLANVFTPGKDGKNDLWRVIYTGYLSVDVKIYNRWGVLVYMYQLPDGEDWNGKVDNLFVECPEGVYFYHVFAKARKEADHKNVHGVIHLIRE